MYRHSVQALNWLSSCLRSFFTSLSWFRKHSKVKHFDEKKNFAFQWNTLYFEETWKRPRIVCIFLSGEMKQLSFLGNYWALLSIYGNLIYATKSTRFGTNMAACFNDLKDEESFVRQTKRLIAQFFRQFEQQPEGKALFKSKFSELGEMKENSFPIVQTMTAYLWSRLWTINNKIFF